ncbi:galactose-1-phosphate uridylyltransferase [Histoplasma capsulatum]|uniref:Galactose-1-phosphate uridylyltransferase n=1 Tax=Ajellomyces capsulatus TaxID=5037 RepID=A0A8A1MGD6_AJECA|nr:galactose-1-phosphate uridylyltransferase [Histoplasma capsulatum]
MLCPYILRQPQSHTCRPLPSRDQAYYRCLDGSIHLTPIAYIPISSNGFSHAYITRVANFSNIATKTPAPLHADIRKQRFRHGLF